MQNQHAGQSAYASSKLCCQQEDAALARRALAKVWQAFRTGHSPDGDRLERAVLACQMRDAEQLRASAAALGHVTGRADLGGAARA